MNNDVWFWPTCIHWCDLYNVNRPARATFPMVMVLQHIVGPDLHVFYHFVLRNGFSHVDEAELHVDQIMTCMSAVPPPPPPSCIPTGHGLTERSTKLNGNGRIYSSFLEIFMCINRLRILNSNTEKIKVWDYTSIKFNPNKFGAPRHNSFARSAKKWTGSFQILDETLFCWI